MAKWTFDQAHTQANFSARHMMVSTVRGSFRKVDGVLDFDPDNPAAASVEAVIDVASMDSTGVEQRDQHLLSPDFLDVEKYPTITFKSTRVEPNNDNTKAKVYGDLTIKDVTREVVLDVEFHGEGITPYGQNIVGFEASTKIDREDFGLTWNVALETGGWLVGKDIKISIDAEFIKVTEEEAQEA
ncbi:MAG: polyisoprenoid-binding protein [Phototrophicales bacterium]|nr:MAG: polyisoprenoid-binding protein [Phototrophicales bacterium]